MSAKHKPAGWVFGNTGASTGVFHRGEKCPSGWVGLAYPVYEDKLLRLSAAEVQQIHNQTLAGHALIRLVESYIFSSVEEKPNSDTV